MVGAETQLLGRVTFEGFAGAWPEGEGDPDMDEVDGVILVATSAALVHGLIATDLLDELRLMVFPVILGGGERLFADDDRKVPLRLTDARTVGAGVQLLTYERTA